MGQSSIIMVATLAIVFTIVAINSDSRINDVSNKAISYYSENASQNICNSATEMLMTQLANDIEYRVVDVVAASFLNGDVFYTLVDTVIDGQDKIKIRVIANYNDEKTENIIITSIPTNGFIPAAVKAAASVNGDIQLLGTITIDGRNHDTNGNLIGGDDGTHGTWSTGTLNQSGASKIGGTDEATDYVPTNPADANVVLANQVVVGGYPNTPDKAMGGEDEGFPEGYLKGVAQSGVHGSQYVTDPSDLTHPLSGVTYVDIPDTWNAADISGSGVLIVHNNDIAPVMSPLDSLIALFLSKYKIKSKLNKMKPNAILSNATGTFVGLLIADEIDKIHGTIIGGLIGITPSPASGDLIGNGNGNILYSSEAIKIASTKTDVLVTNEIYFDEKHRLEIDYWMEL